MCNWMGEIMKYWTGFEPRPSESGSQLNKLSGACKKKGLTVACFPSEMFFIFHNKYPRS